MSLPWASPGLAPAASLCAWLFLELSGLVPFPPMVPHAAVQTEHVAGPNKGTCVLRREAPPSALRQPDRPGEGFAVIFHCSWNTPQACRKLRAWEREGGRWEHGQKDGAQASLLFLPSPVLKYCARLHQAFFLKLLRLHSPPSPPSLLFSLSILSPSPHLLLWGTWENPKLIRVMGSCACIRILLSPLSPH